MKKTAFIFGLIGSIAGAALGLKWLGDLNSSMGKAALSLSKSMGSAGSQFLGLRNATYALLICAIIGLIFSFIILMRKGNKFINSGVLVVAGILPMLFASKAMFGIPMAIAGLLALTVKYTDIEKKTEDND